MTFINYSLGLTIQQGEDTVLSFDIDYNTPPLPVGTTVKMYINVFDYYTEFDAVVDEVNSTASVTIGADDLSIYGVGRYQLWLQDPTTDPIINKMVSSDILTIRPDIKDGLPAPVAP